MSKESELEHPTGAVQGLCTGAMGWLALLLAFIGYSGFNADGENIKWSKDDLYHLIFALIAFISFAAVPWVATKPA